MSGHDIEVRLSGTDVPDGEISVTSLVSIGTALQELLRRIGCHGVDQDGAGRTPVDVEAMTTLRLRSLSTGSTRLGLTMGDVHALPDAGSAFEGAIEEQFWQIVVAIEAGQRPDWVSDPIADSTIRLIDALRQSASSAELKAPRGERIRIETRSIARDVWAVPRRVESDRQVIVAGRLEAVDLKTAKFRIRDDVGNEIPLESVSDPEEAARLVGREVSASGQAVHDRQGRLRSVSGPTLWASDVPPEWTSRRRGDLAALLESGPGPDPEGGTVLTDDEFNEFLSLIHG